MRPLVLLLALCVAMPFALAQGPGPDGQGASDDRPGSDNRTHGAVARECRGSDAPRDCMESYCQEHPDERSCQRIRGSDCARVDCAELSRSCDAAQSGNASAGRACSELQELDDLRAKTRHIDFELDREGRRLLNYSVDGHLLLASIAYGNSSDDFDVDRNGNRIRFDSDHSRLEVHDTPTGDFWFRGSNASLVLTFPEGVAITPSPRGHLADYGGRTAVLAGSGVQLDGQTLTAVEAFRFFSPVGTGPAQAAEALTNATARGHVGAKVDLMASEANVTTYDDVTIQVSQPQVIYGNDTLRVLVEAELDEGRTIILDVDPATLGGPDLVLRYYDVHGANETEIVFRQASSLADALDPTDDAGQPEYWIVEDADGLHVMVSVPHWSAHIIEVASVGEFLVQPSVLLGVAAGVAGVGVAGAAMFWPRRRDGSEF